MTSLSSKCRKSRDSNGTSCTFLAQWIAHAQSTQWPKNCYRKSVPLPRYLKQNRTESRGYSFEDSEDIEDLVCKIYFISYQVNIGHQNLVLIFSSFFSSLSFALAALANSLSISLLDFSDVFLFFAALGSCLAKLKWRFLVVKNIKKKSKPNSGVLYSLDN